MVGRSGRIDAHHHLWKLDAVHYPWLMAKGQKRFFGDPGPIQRDFTVDEFRAMAEPFGVAASVHIQVGAADPLAEARWVQGVAEANPGWPAAQVGFADLTDPALGRLLDAFAELPGLRGVRQIVGRAPGEDAVTGTGALLDDPRFAQGLAEIARRGLSFDLQLIPSQYADMARILDRTPELDVALCHAGSPHDRSADGLRAWASALRVLSANPRICCKLSGLGMFDHDWTVASIRPIVETCLEQFGAERLMFGSNFPVDSLYSDYGAIVEAYEAILPPDSWPAVFAGTAARFYRIDLPA